MAVTLDSYSFMDKKEDQFIKENVMYNKIKFEFPDGFTQLRLIEECRAINALDTSIPENFDLMYDITMQMLVGKVVEIRFIEDDKETLVEQFVVTDRYMNLRGVGLIDAYPVIVNWLVEFIAGYLGKKYPRSLKDIQAVMSERKERMKSLRKKETVLRTSFPMK